MGRAQAAASVKKLRRCTKGEGEGEGESEGEGEGEGEGKP